MLREAVESFLQQDADLATRTMVMEEQANTLRNSINAELAELSRRNQLPAAALTPLMTIARRFERVTDQAKNLCEEVLYMCTGEFAKHKGADAFRILFFDLDNALPEPDGGRHRHCPAPASICLQQRRRRAATDR